MIVIELIKLGHSLIHSSYIELIVGVKILFIYPSSDQKKRQEREREREHFSFFFFNHSPSIYKCSSIHSHSPFLLSQSH